MGKSKKHRKLIKAAKMGKPYAMYQIGLYFDTDNTAAWMYAAAEAGYEPAAVWMKDYAFDDNAFVQAES